jgi:hypothetical protein
MSINIDTRISQGVGRIMRWDAKAYEEAVPKAAVRAGRGARQSLQRAIRAQFKRHKAMGGKAFADTLPKIRPQLQRLDNGAMGVRVYTKAWFNHRRGRSFDLFWLFENAPIAISSSKGRMLAVPLPNAQLPLVGRGATRKLPWPRDLINAGWTLTIIPAGRGGLKSPLIIGGAPGTRRQNFKPLYTLHKRAVIKSKLNLERTAKRFADRVPKYIESEFAKIGKRISSRPRAFAIAA